MASGERCIALCDYPGYEPDELAFKKGDIITVLAKGAIGGFWQGQLADKKGLFPNCFVTSNMTTRKEPVFCDKAVALYDLEPRDSSCMPLKRYDLITVVREGRTGWWWGINETRRATRRRLKASNSKAAPVATASDDEPELLFPSNFVTCNVVCAVFQFQGRSRHELSIDIGDVIIVHRRWNDGWWEGSNTNVESERLDAGGPSAAATDDPTAEERKFEEQDYKSRLALRAELAAMQGKQSFVRLRRGIFPSNYTAPNVPTLQPPLFCLRCRTVFAAGTSECKECAKNEETTRTMMQAMSDHSAGLTEPPLDIFRYIDEDHGKGALLSAQDLRDISVRPRLATTQAVADSVKVAL